MIDLIAAAGIGGIIGFGTCAVLTAGKIGDLQEDVRGWFLNYQDECDDRFEAVEAHTRCADALGTTQRKLSAIRDLLDTPRTIRKGELAAVLDGEQG